MTTKFYNKIILIYIQRRTIINFIIYCSLLFYYILFIDDDDDDDCSNIYSCGESCSFAAFFYSRTIIDSRLVRV
jgi:hypothetical protein